MKARLLFFILLQISVFATSGQDKIILINQDTLNVRIVKVGSKNISFVHEEETVENEVAFKFLNKVILSSGRVVKTREEQVVPFTINKESGKIAVLDYSKELEEEADAVFSNSLKQNLRFKLPYNFTSDTFADGTGIILDLLENDEKAFYKDLNFNGYATGAFMVLISYNEQFANCLFYSSPLSNLDWLREFLPGKNFKLLSSEAKSSVTNLIDGTLKEFQLNFKDKSTCMYTNSKSNSELTYTIDDTGNITYTDSSKKKNNSTAYRIIYFDGKVMRYTQFIGNDFITRSIILIN